MKLTEFVKKELSGWKIYESMGLAIVILVIIYNAIFLNDSLIAVCSAICGILYTNFAGKGKISCYFFGLLGSGCYIYLSATNHLWGNAFLYLMYYIPMQVRGIFEWKNNLNKNTYEIIKTTLTIDEKIKYTVFAVLGSIMTIILLVFMQDTSPIIDGVTTFLSILGMYFTVKRLSQQWNVWCIVNGLSFIMWLNLVIRGTKAYSTLVMWGVYFILSIYFYIIWKKEIRKNNVI